MHTTVEVSNCKSALRADKSAKVDSSCYDSLHSKIAYL